MIVRIASIAPVVSNDVQTTGAIGAIRTITRKPGFTVKYRKYSLNINSKWNANLTDSTQHIYSFFEIGGFNLRFRAVKAMQTAANLDR